ncbi:MAG: hypothetical protein CL868_15720 [Cytophagaceae bacterium]|nr:hypothetical protein [Cytophagaceae bacterium]
MQQQKVVAPAEPHSTSNCKLLGIHLVHPVHDFFEHGLFHLLYLYKMRLHMARRKVQKLRVIYLQLVLSYATKVYQRLCKRVAK